MADAGYKEKGTFRITKSGSVEYRFPYYDEFGKRRIKSVTARTEEACLDRADDFIEDYKNRTIGVDYDATIADILRKKAESDYKKNYTGIQGYDRSLKTIQIIERSVIGHIPIADIKEFQLEVFLENITTYSNTMISKIYSMLCSAYRLAYNKGLIQNNYMLSRDFRCPKSQKKDKKVRGLTEEEQKKLVKTLEEHKVPYGRNTYKKQLLIELYGGLRMGEVNALKPENIDFKKGFIHVERTISRGLNSESFLKDEPKTAAGVRDVPISNILEPILREAIAEMKDNPYGLIFYDHIKDGLIETTQVNCFYRRMCEKAEIEYNGQHALRHTFATRCIEAGIPALVLKNWLGHTDIHITLDTYADVFNRMHLGSIKKFERLMNQVMSDDESEDASVIYLDRRREAEEPVDEMELQEYKYKY